MEQPELKVYELPTAQLVPYANNAKIHDAEQVRQIERSIEQFGFNDPIAVWTNSDGEPEIIEGHGRVMAAKNLGIEAVPVVYLDHLTDAQRRAYTHIHNQLTMNSGFDFEVLEADIAELPEFDWELFGFDVPDGTEIFARANVFDGNRKTDGQSEEYSEFVEKFEPKRTTDDCYTPANIYDCVLGWAAERYGMDAAMAARPFFPGGDYEAFDYSGKWVCDNPPFSKMAEIERFYRDKGVKYFLFAPGLTCLRPDELGVTVVCAGVQVVYDNGAKVNTSFVTNMDEEYRLITAPDLADAISDANDENARMAARELPVYEYPDNVITSAKGNWLARHHTEYKVKKRDSTFIRELDAQDGKGIFGGGLLLSERAAAERAAAERAAAERVAAKRFELSEREREIVAMLGGETE